MVTDDGEGLNGRSAGLQEGIGLGNTRQRLRKLYGDEHRLELIGECRNGADAVAAILEKQPDLVLAIALLDRLLHHATTLNIRGESYRLRHRRKAGLLTPHPNAEVPMTS